MLIAAQEPFPLTTCPRSCSPMPHEPAVLLSLPWKATSSRSAIQSTSQCRSLRCETLATSQTTPIPHRDVHRREPASVSPTRWNTFVRFRQSRQKPRLPCRPSAAILLRAVFLRSSVLARPAHKHLGQAELRSMLQWRPRSGQALLALFWTSRRAHISAEICSTGSDLCRQCLQRHPLPLRARHLRAFQSNDEASSAWSPDAATTVCLPYPRVFLTRISPPRSTRLFHPPWLKTMRF